VKTVIGSGTFVGNPDGVQTLAKFKDYIVFPDKERTEFRSGGAPTVQTNFKGGGWIYDGAALTDQTPEQLEEFRLSARTSVENLLRGGWREQGVKLTYAGRREGEEALIDGRREALQLTYSDGFWVEYEFWANEGTPVKVHYERKQKNRETGKIESSDEIDYLKAGVPIDGVTVPREINHYTNKIHTSRIIYDIVEYNTPIADSLFTKPTNVNAIK
jgi:hypothetical protein